jgi:protein-tyrosine phosphatase
MAAGLARKMVADRLGCEPSVLEDHGIQIASVGTGAFEGERASPDAFQAMEERGVDISDHRSRPMTVDALLTADYIWVRTRAHKASVVRLAPEVGDRVALLDPGGDDIPDPIGGTLEEYRSCARHIERAMADRIAEML